MNCPNCGAELNPDSKFCRYCGAPVTTEDTAPAVQNTAVEQYAPDASYAPDAQYSPARPAPANLKQFVLSFCSETLRKTLKSAWILMYVFAGISLAYAILIGAAPYDAILLTAIATWMMLTYSPASAITALVVSVLEFVLMIVFVGKPGGWLVIIAAVYATIYTLRAKKYYNNYLASGELPPQEEPDARSRRKK